MKRIAIIIAFVSLVFIGCAYKCEANKRPHCTELYPSGPAPGNCNTQYERWFYIPGTDECEKKTYWGCTTYGFDTKNECEKCRCHD